MLAKTSFFQKEQNLSVVQITTSNQNSFNYISGPLAIKDNLIEVKEVSEGGSVNTLHVFNLSNQFVFFMDGEILSGAKQNRVLNTSVLLAPNTKSHIPVSCVERGRWSHISAKFGNTDYSAPSFLRANKAARVTESLNKGMLFESDQSEVWNHVDEYSDKFQVKSASHNFSDIYDEKKKDFDEYIKNFTLNKDANGMAVFVRNNLLSLDIFNRTDIYAEYFPQLLKGCAMEAFGLKGESNMTESEASFKTLTFLDQFENLAFNEHAGVGVGMEKRFRSEDLTGFELVYSSNMIHLTALNLKKEGK